MRLKLRWAVSDKLPSSCRSKIRLPVGTEKPRLTFSENALPTYLTQKSLTDLLQPAQKPDTNSAMKIQQTHAWTGAEANSTGRKHAGLCSILSGSTAKKLSSLLCASCPKRVLCMMTKSHALLHMISSLDVALKGIFSQNAWLSFCGCKT